MPKEKKWLEALYEAAASEDDEGQLTKFDEQKLRRYLEANNELFARNKEIFRNHESNFYTCKRYNPCQICDKCLNKASHIYVKCQTCNIPICTHTYENRKTMIKRRNFRLPVSKDVYRKLEKLSNKVINGEFNEE